MTPLDLKTKEEWEEILDRFSEETQMTACLTDPAGNQYFCRNDRYPLCSTIRDNQESLTYICSQSSSAMIAVIDKTRKPETDLCEAGMIRTVVPVLNNGDMVGVVTACGLASDEEEIDEFLVSKQLDITEESALELIKETPSRSEDEIEEISEQLFRKLNAK